jgi:hypothetical protein
MADAGFRDAESGSEVGLREAPGASESSEVGRELGEVRDDEHEPIRVNAFVYFATVNVLVYFATVNIFVYFATVNVFVYFATTDPSST